MGHWVNRPYGSPFGTRYAREWEGDYSNYPSGQNPPIPGDRGYTPRLDDFGYTPSSGGSGYKPVPVYREGPLTTLGYFIPWFIVWLVFVAIVAGGLLGLSILVKNNLAKEVFSAGSTWDGVEFKYNHEAYNSGQTEMILNIDSIKNGSFYGKINWQRMSTVTEAMGTITKDISTTKDSRWKYITKYITQCSSKGIYLQLTETKFIHDSGYGVILNVKYYAVVCDGTLSGVWFYPDQPNGSPGGEFSLQWKFP